MYGLVWLVMLVDYFLEQKSIGAFRKKITITTGKLVSTSELEKVLANRSHQLLAVEVNKKEDKMIVTFLVEGSKNEINTLSRDLLQQSWFSSCKVE